jgi:gliding motility-associated-like protein
MDTVYKIVKVDLPSKLEVPNIFTHNGDGSNDFFFLKAASMGEIHAIIFDRWGNRVYESTSNSGNILWDGKNLQGKDCADGGIFISLPAREKMTSIVSLYR